MSGIVPTPDQRRRECARKLRLCDRRVVQLETIANRVLDAYENSEHGNFEEALADLRRAMEQI